MIWIVLVVIAVVIAAAFVVRSRQRQVTDGVDSFRRQIDALSPEARRPVIDQVQKQVEADPDDGDDADGA